MKKQEFFDNEADAKRKRRMDGRLTGKGKYLVKANMNIINLTPHVINVQATDGEKSVFQPSGMVARVATETSTVKIVNGIHISRSTPGEVTNLPDRQANTMFIVSMAVRTSCPDREDVLSPGTLIRDENGQPIGCNGLVCN